jgi:hypothetical protein
MGLALETSSRNSSIRESDDGDGDGDSGNIFCVMAPCGTTRFLARKKNLRQDEVFTIKLYMRVVPAM